MKKSLILAGLFTLVFVCLFAQTGGQSLIELISPDVEVIGSTRTVAPVLRFRHHAAIVPEPTPVQVAEAVTYRIIISTDPTLPVNVHFDNNEVTEVFLFPVAGGSDLERAFTDLSAHPLKYDTIYYWQVRQFHPGTGTLIERQNPSEVGTFRTPKMSVAPQVRIQPFIHEATHNYRVQVLKNGTIVHDSGAPAHADLTVTPAVLPPGTPSPAIHPTSWHIIGSNSVVLPTVADLLEYNTTYTERITK